MATSSREVVIGPVQDDDARGINADGLRRCESRALCTPIGSATGLGRLAVDRPEAAITQDLDSARGGQPKDTVPQQVPLRPPPFEERTECRGNPVRWANEDQDPAVLVRESILAEKVLIMGDKEKTPRAPMNFGVGGISAEAAFSFALADLAKARQAGQLAGNVSANVVVEQDEGRLLRLLRLAPRQG